MSGKQKLHKLVDELPEDELGPAELFLAYLKDGRSDPLLLKLATAPWDDEPETEEERQAVEEAKTELARGEGIPWEEIRADFLGRG